MLPPPVLNLLSNPKPKRLPSHPKLSSAEFGLFAKSPKAPLPLTKVDIKADIHESIAKVTFSQTYQNPSDVLLETEYFFPIPPNARFDAFQARYEGVTINGIIKEKEKAKEEYQKNLEKGNTVAYSEILKEAADVMKVEVGNIKPFTQIQITFSYIQKLTIVRSRFYKFVFYSTLGPRYHSNTSESKEKETLTLSQYPVMKPKEGYIWNIEVNVKCNSLITYLDCPSHKTIKTQESSNLLKGRISLSPENDSVFNKDFEVLLSYAEINSPAVRLAKNENGYCAMIDFLPRYDDDSLDDAIKAATQQSTTPTTTTTTGNPDDVNMLTATGEYIFLIDRSGSMSGQRIEMAKEALLFALKSLPPNSFFNVYSFGSSYTALFTSSMASDEKNVSDAINKIKTFIANMGGTEIYEALVEILSQPRKRNHPRTLFLLTDGEVDNSDQVISLIESNNHRARVFSLGIGNSCSTYLVNGCASAGKGKSEYVSDLKGISEKVISLMESAFTPVCDDFTLEFTDKEAVSMIAPDPQSLPYLLRDEKATFFVFLKNEAIKSANENGEFIVTLKNFDTATGGYRTSPIKLNLKEYETSLDLFKLGIGEAADILEKKSRDVSQLVKENPDVFWAMKEGINDELVKLSVENQVLTRRTAFVAVVKENNPDEIGSLEKEKMLVPQVLSSDYAESKKGVSSNYAESKKGVSQDLLQRLRASTKLGAANPTSLERNLNTLSRQPAIDHFESLRAQINRRKAALCSKRSDSSSDSDDDDFAGSKTVTTTIERVGAHSHIRGLGLPQNKINSLFDDDDIKLLSTKPSNNKSAGKSLFEDDEDEGVFTEKVKSKPLQKPTTKESGMKTDSKDRKVIEISEEHKSEALPGDSKKSVDTSEKSFLDIIQNQKPLGNWEVATQYLDILGISREELLTNAPEAVKNAKGADVEQTAITLFLLVWIERYFDSKKGAWSLIHQKGVQWLKSVGVKYADVSVEVNFI